jgi:hypothetical protein
VHKHDTYQFSNAREVRGGFAVAMRRQSVALTSDKRRGREFIHSGRMIYMRRKRERSAIVYIKWADAFLLFEYDFINGNLRAVASCTRARLSGELRVRRDVFRGFIREITS